jgi:hypothetical protein
VSIRNCRRAEVDKIVNTKRKLTIRDFKPKTDFNIELVVSANEFGNVSCQTPYVSRDFDTFVCKATCRFTYGKFWPIAAKFEGDKVLGNDDRIVDKEAIKDVCLMFKFLSVSCKNNP